MNIEFGAGVVSLNVEIKAIVIKYTGNIIITESPDNLLIMANNKKIVATLLDSGTLSGEIFKYSGEFKIIRALAVLDDDTLVRLTKSTPSLGFWGTTDVWEDNNIKYDEAKESYTSGFSLSTTPKQICINQNIKVGDSKFKGEDGKVIDNLEYIHIYSDGTSMSGPSPTPDSVKIFKDIKISKKSIAKIVRPNTPSNRNIVRGY